MADDMSETRYHKRVKDNPWAEWVSKDVTDEVAGMRARLEACDAIRTAHVEQVAALREKLTWYEGAVPSVAEMQALRAEYDSAVNDATVERANHVREVAALRAELAGWQTTAQQYEEIVRTTEAELERITTERDAANRRYELMRAQSEQNLAQYHRAVGIEQDGVRLDALARLLADRVATSEQEAPTCSCGKPERGRGPWHSPGRCALYAGALDLPIEASEQEASDHADPWYLNLPNGIFVGIGVLIGLAVAVVR